MVYTQEKSLWCHGRSDHSKGEGTLAKKRPSGQQLHLGVGAGSAAAQGVPLDNMRSRAINLICFALFKEIKGSIA